MVRCSLRHSRPVATGLLLGASSLVVTPLCFGQALTPEEATVVASQQLHAITSSMMVVSMAGTCGVLPNGITQVAKAELRSRAAEALSQQKGADWQSTILASERMGQARATPSMCNRLRANPPMTLAIKQAVSALIQFDW